MVKKNNYKKNKNNKNKKNNKNRKTNFIKKYVKKEVKNAIEANTEDKYWNETSFTSLLSGWNGSDHSILHNLTPLIANITHGDDVDQRQGNKINLKYLRMYIRHQPARYGVQMSIDSTTPTYTRNPIPDIPDVKVFIVKLNNELVSNISDSQLRAILKTRFRPYGSSWIDTAQSSGRAGLKGLTVIAKCEIKNKYKTLFGDYTRQDQYGSVQLPTSIMDGAITLSETYAPSLTVLNIPQQSNKTLMVASKAFKQKIELNATSNYPIKYQYYMYVQFSDDYQNLTYNPVNMPNEFECRCQLVYENV